jgi:hypothetical protein
VCADSVNTLISDLVQPTSEIARAPGLRVPWRLSQRMSLEVDARPLKGEFARTTVPVNTWWSN